jgi:hypothetical protein
MGVSGCSGSNKPGTSPVCPPIYGNVGSITFFRNRGTYKIVPYASCASGSSFKLEDLEFDICPQDNERATLSEKLASVCSSNGPPTSIPITYQPSNVDTTGAPSSASNATKDTTGAPSSASTATNKVPITPGSVIVLTPGVVATTPLPTQALTTAPAKEASTMNIDPFRRTI